MIMVKTPLVNRIDQKFYDTYVNRIDLMKIRCPHCSHCGAVIHGYYLRKVKTPVGKLCLRIMRIRCSFCGKTHAVLVSALIPYSQISFSDTLAILVSDNTEERKALMEENNLIDESDIYRVLSSFNKHWKERLRSFFLSLEDEDLCGSCLRLFQRQFMQIRCTLCGAYC